MKILIVDNNLHVKGYLQPLIVRSHLGLKAAFRARVRKPLELTNKDLDVDKVILTGSMAYVRQEKPWMKKELEFIDWWMKREIPILGVCFGAQLLAVHIFNKNSVVPMPIPVTGSIEFSYKKECPLFIGLPNPLGVVTTHYDGFVVPKKFNVGSSDEWPCYAFHYPSNIYGIQFHPELMGPIGRTIIRIQKLIYDRHVYQDFSVKTYSKYGKKIYMNFLDL